MLGDTLSWRVLFRTHSGLHGLLLPKFWFLPTRRLMTQIRCDRNLIDRLVRDLVPDAPLHRPGSVEAMSTPGRASGQALARPEFGPNGSKWAESWSNVAQTGRNVAQNLPSLDSWGNSTSERVDIARGNFSERVASSFSVLRVTSGTCRLCGGAAIIT